MVAVPATGGGKTLIVTFAVAFKLLQSSEMFTVYVVVTAGQTLIDAAVDPLLQL